MATTARLITRDQYAMALPRRRPRWWRPSPRAGPRQHDRPARWFPALHRGM